MEPMTPRPEQEEAIQEILLSKAHLCRGQVGSGKTLIGVEAVLRSGAKITIVVCPLNTFAGWRKTFIRQSQGTVTPRVIDGRKEGKLAFEAMAGREPGVYLLSWERFRMYDWIDMPLDFVILDEVHRQQNRRATTHASVKTTRNAEYKLALSATPWGNRLEGAWATLVWLWWGQHEVVGRNQSFWNWVTKHFQTELDRYVGKKILGERVQGSVWSSVPSKSFFPSPYQEEPIIHEIECEMTPFQRKIYDRFEQEAIVWLEDRPLVADLPAIMRLRLREICLAVPSIKEGWVRKQDPDTLEWEKVWGEIVYFEPDAKSSKAEAVIDKLNDLFAAEPFPVLIYTHSRKFATMLTERLQAKKFNARQFVGGMPSDERNWKLENFGKEFDVMVATISGIAEGTDGLQDVCWTEFWLSLEDNRVLNEQTLGRLSRGGQTKTVQRYMFLAKDTVEQVQRGKLQADQEQLDGSFQPMEVSS
jgi:superfamily II DNA or RNA helicase